MSTPQGIIRVCRQGSMMAFRIVGWGTMEHSLPLRHAAEEALADGATALRVDLTECEHIDSTFIGTLLVLKRTTDAREHGDFALVAPSEKCARVLQGMGLDGVFPLRSPEEVAGCRWAELPLPAGDVEACKGNVVRAHQELASLEGPAGEAFRKVVRCLRDAEEK